MSGKGRNLTRLEKLVLRLRRTPIAVALALLAAAIIGLGQLTGALGAILEFPEKIASRDTIPKAPAAGSVLVDLSQRQGEWQNLTSYLRQSGLDLTEITAPLTAKTLANPRGSVLILPLPFHEHLADSKIAAIKTWVERGGGLLVLGHYAADMHHGSNPSALTRTWGLKLAPAVLLPLDAATCDRGHAFDRSQKFAV